MARSPKRPNPEPALLSYHRLRPMTDIPLPRPHAGKKSKRTHARPWERA